MFRVVTSVAVFTVLCLATKALRFYGVIGIAILALLFPSAALVLAFTGATAYLLFRLRST